MLNVSQFSGLRGVQEWNAGSEEQNNSGPKPFDSDWEKDSRIMIGIDIGSTQSGVAVAFLQKGVKQTVHRVNQWPGQALEHQSKIPTLVWYDKHGQAKAFGAEATTQEARDDAEENGWTLAKRFKLHMHPSEMREKYSIKLENLPNGVTLSQIYADFMSYLLKYTEPFFKDRIVDGPKIWETYKDSATFIIAHPNGWGIREQEFLRRAAIEGGLVGTGEAKTRVQFVSEAEASVHYCLTHSNIYSRLRIGLNFAVCDAGGSTIDTTVYTVTAMSPMLKLAEMRDSACIQAGGLYVDDAVETYLEEALTGVGMEDSEIKEYVQEAVRDFEAYPKRLFPEASEKLRIKFGDKGLTNSDIRIRRGIMTVDITTAKGFFDHCVRAITRSIDDQIRGNNVSHILLVGGFGDSPYLQQQLKKRYDGTGPQLTTANDSTSKAVAEGAIMWNTMTSVFSRAPNWSYGIQGYIRFDSYLSDHRERTTFTTPDGYEKITGVWCEIVKKGVTLNVNDVCRQSFFRTYATPHPNLEIFEIALYSYSGTDQPKWLRSKGGSLLGGFVNVCLITADLRGLSGALEPKIGPRGTYWGLLFWVCVRFGDTEITAYLEWEEAGETHYGPISIIPQGLSCSLNVPEVSKKPGALPMTSAKFKVATHHDQPRDEPHLPLSIQSQIPPYPSLVSQSDLGAIMSGNNRGNTRHTAASNSGQGANRQTHEETPHKKWPMVLLVLGPHGCGKSHFINKILGSTNCHTSVNSRLSTRNFRCYKVSSQGDEIRVIDSPGFGNDIIEDRVILEELVRYFAPKPAKTRSDGQPDLPDRVTGIIYIHRENEVFNNRSSQKTTEMLTKIMGEECLGRVTVLIQSESKVHGDFSKSSPPRESPVYPLYCNGTRPRTIIYDDSPQSIKNILEHYARFDPLLVRLAATNNFVQGGSWRYNDIPHHLKELFPDDVGPRKIMDQPELRSRLQEQESKLEAQRISLNKQAAELEDLRSVQEAEWRKSDELQNSLNRLTDEIKSLQITHEADQNDLKELRDLLAQKEKERIELQSNYDNEQQKFQIERVRKEFNHEVSLKSLQNKIEDHEAQLLTIESSWTSKLNELEVSKNAKIDELVSEKTSEINRLQAELKGKDEQLMQLETTKEEEMKKLNLEKDSKIDSLRNEVRRKDEELTKHKPASVRNIQEHMGEVRPGNNSIERKLQVNGAVTKTEGKQEDEIDRLRADNYRISAEYASLRSHMQLEENTEQGDITTALGDINRLIEEFGGSLTERIEEYMEQNPPERAFQAQDLLGLFIQGGDGIPLKVKHDAYVFLEYAIQSIVCDQLYTHLFKPFHPFVSADEKRNTFVTQLYQHMTYQEPQSVAGRWRKDAFNSISRDLSLGSQDEPNNERTHRLIITTLSTLLGKLIDIQLDDVMKEHARQLFKVIVKAEEFNSLVKGKVSIMGDFWPTVFPFGEPFQSDSMTEVDLKAKKTKHPETVVGTVSFGLVKRNALGGGRKPEETVLRRAVVFGLSK